MADDCLHTMEKTKKSKVKVSVADATKITASYRTYLLAEGKQPATVFKFCKEHGFNETDFYLYFASFEAIEKSIWKNYVSDTVARMIADASYQNFTVREKILTFYFMLAEQWKEDRSFVLFQFKGWKNPSLVPAFLKGFKSEFNEWLNQVLNEGKGTGEIAKRPVFDQSDDRYAFLVTPNVCSCNFGAMMIVPNFEKTDAAIEKSVNLAFDLIGKGVLDNAIDFGKFLYQNSKN
jgi:AcrR family transcriptional regulator